MLSFILVGKSLIYSKNNNGPNIEPCGTPEVTFSQPDLHPDITALCCRPYNYDSKHFRSLPVKTIFFNFRINKSCGTLSKALEKTGTERQLAPGRRLWYLSYGKIELNE